MEPKHIPVALAVCGALVASPGGLIYDPAGALMAAIPGAIVGYVLGFYVKASIEEREQKQKLERKISEERDEYRARLKELEQERAQD